MRPGEALRRISGVRLGALYRERPRALVLDFGAAAQVGSSELSVGIVTPVFNQAPYIAQTVSSVLGQGYPNLSYLVKDGGSTDGTLAAIGPERGALRRVVSGTDGGQAQALNIGFGMLPSVDVMAYLNGDDLLLPGALAVVVEFLRKNPQVDVVYGHRVLIDEQSREVGRWVMPAHADDVLSWRDYVPQETLFWRQSIWQAVGARFDENFRFALDWDLLLRFRQAGARFARLPHFLGAFRLHADQKTAKEMKSIGQEEIDRIHHRTLGKSTSRGEELVAVAPYLFRHACLNWHYRITGSLPKD